MSAHFPNLGAASNAADAKPVSNGPSPSVAAIPAQGWQFAHLIRTPTDPIVAQRFEFTGLALKLREHLVNQVAVATRDEAARMLWVQGKPGEGKSEGCLVACLKAGFHVAVLSPGMFTGKEEGAPIELLHALMAEMVRWSIVHKCRVVIIIDDFDLSIANVGENTGHTIHSQLVVNEFMALADKRHLYRNGDGSNIAFIMTVNDATGMRESLHRPGRAIWYDHEPSTEDKTNIAWTVLDPKTVPERDLVHALVRKYAARQSVAFWKALYFKMQALQAEALISKGMPDTTSIDAAYGNRVQLTPAIAWEAARQLRTSRVRSFLIKRFGGR